jgi:hypothetical protein
MSPSAERAQFVPLGRREVVKIERWARLPVGKHNRRGAGDGILPMGLSVEPHSVVLLLRGMPEYLPEPEVGRPNRVRRGWEDHSRLSPLVVISFGACSPPGAGAHRPPGAASRGDCLGDWVFAAV